MGRFHVSIEEGKGLLERQRVTAAEQRPQAGKAYVYTPRISETEFTNAAVTQWVDRLRTHYPAVVHAHITGVPTLSRCGSSNRAKVGHVLACLGTLCDPLGLAVDTTVLVTITALLVRAEAAERTAATRETEIQVAEQRAAAAKQRAVAAERHAQASEQLAARLTATSAPPRSMSKNRPPLAPIYEYGDVAGICRVCGRKAPSQSAARQDDLRVLRRSEPHRGAAPGQCGEAAPRTGAPARVERTGIG